MYGRGLYGLSPYGKIQVPKTAARRYIVDGEFIRFVRFTVSGTTYAFGTSAEVRDNIKHDEGLMLEGLSVVQQWPEEDGIVELNSITATVADPDGSLKSLIYDATLPGTTCLVEQVIRRTYNDGFTKEKSFCHKFTITSATSRALEVSFNMREIGTKMLDKKWPSDTFQESDWPELFKDHVGRTIAEAHGQCEKIRGALVDTNGGAGPWIYAFHVNTGAGETQQTVYRDGVIVDAAEYTWTTIAGGGKTLTAISFPSPFDPVGFGGNYAEVDIDVIGENTKNPVRIAEHLLVDVLGETVHQSAFDAAAQEMVDQGIEIDYPFGRDGQDTIRSILGYMMFYARAGLKRLADGSWSIFQDRKNDNIRYVLNEDEDDKLEVLELRMPERPTDVGIAYKPNNRKTNEMMHEIRRTVTGGFSGSPSPFEAFHIWQHTVADRIAYYLSKTSEFNRVIDVTQTQIDPLVGDYGTIISTNVLPQNFSGRITDITQEEFGSTFTLREIDDAIYTYSAGTLPQDATIGYLPDYSKTRPEAPTGIEIVDGAAPVKADGTVRAWVHVRCTPPTENFNSIIFWIVNKNTNAQTILDAEEIVGGANDGKWEIIFDNLHPEDTYDLFSQAINRFGVDGFTGSYSGNPFAAATAATPNAPTGLTAEATAGKTIVLEWDKPSEDDVDEVEIHRSVTTGFTPGAGTLIAEEKGTTFSDTRGDYGTTYFYKVKFVSSSNLVSAESNEASATVPTVDAAGVNKNAPASLSGITLAIGSSSTYQDAQGNGFARIRLDLSSVPADSDRAYIQIRHRKSGTSNYRLDDQIQLASGSQSVWIDDLVPNIEYVFSAQPVSHFGIAGTDKTLTDTTPSDSVSPSAPTNVSISQRTALYGEAFITATEPSDFLRYEYQIWSPLGSSWGNTRKAGNQDTFIWALQNYASGQKIRVRLVDTSGNTSSFTESGTINPARNIGNADVADNAISTTRLVDDDVTTAKRQDTSTVSSSTVAYGGPGEAASDTLSINESKPPVALGGRAINNANKPGILSAVIATSTTTITIGSYSSSGNSLTKEGYSASARYW